MSRIRPVAAVAVGTVLALASCGGDSEDPLDQALGVLPADAPLVVTVSTDFDGAAYEDVDAALQRFGVEGGLDGSLEALGDPEEGISFARDVRPLLDGDLVVGLPPSPGGLGDGEEYFPATIAAVTVNDGGAVRELLGDAGLEEIDQVEGASVYGVPPPEEESDAEAPEGPGIAIDGDLVVAAQSRREVEQALAQRGEDDRLTQALFSERLGDLPGGIVRAAGDIPSALEGLGIEQTVAVPWVESLRSYGATLDVEGSTLGVDAAVSGEEVAENDLPLDPGPSSPRVLKDRPTVATRDQAQSVEFALSVVRAAVPQAAFEEVTNRLQRHLDGSVASLVDQFGEGLVARLPGETTVTRSVVEDPASVAKALHSLRDEVPLLAQLGGSSSEVGGALEAARYAIPALPISEPQSFPSGSKVRAVPGMPDLYRLTPPAPDLPPRVPEAIRSRLSRPELVFGLIDGVFVTAPSLKAARDAREASPIQADLPPGALAFRIPVKASALGLPETAGVGVTVTTIEGGVEASTTGLRLRAQAEL